MKAFILSLLLRFSCHEVIDIDTVLAMVVRESDGHPHLIHPTSGAIGLLQVKPIVLQDYNHKHKTTIDRGRLLEPRMNLTIGVWHLCRRAGVVKSAKRLVAIYYAGYRGFSRNMADPTSRGYRAMMRYVEGVFERKWIIRSFKRAERSLTKADAKDNAEAKREAGKILYK